MARTPDPGGAGNDERTDRNGRPTEWIDVEQTDGREERSDAPDDPATPRCDRRNYMHLLGGSVAAVAGLGVAGAASAAEEYETVTVPAGERQVYSLGSGDVLENVLVDVTASGAEVRITARGDDWIIRNVGVKGEIDVGDDAGYNQVVNVEGNGLVENLYLGDGVEFGTDKSAMHVGNDHAGHIEFRNMYVAEWSSNAIYAAGFGRINGPGQTDGAGGTVAFRNCYFRDNNIAHLRLAADGTVVENCVFHNTNNVPPIPETHGGVEDVVNSRGIYTGYGDPEQEIRVENCHMAVTGENTCGEGVDHNYCAASVAVSGTHSTYGELTTVRIVDSQVRGRLVGDHVVTENVGSEPDVTPPELAPMNPEEAASGLAGSGDSGNPLIGEGTNTLTVTGGSSTEVVEYTFTVADWVETGPQANSEDTVDGRTATGAVAGGTDSFEFGGDVTGFSSTGEVTVRINGVAVDLATLSTDSTGDGDSGNEDGGDGSSDDGSDDGDDSNDEESPDLPNTIAVSGGDSSTIVDYRISVSEAIELGPNTNPEDAVSGRTAVGAVGGGTDDYHFAGEVTEFTATGDVSVTINGEAVDPDQLGDGTADGSDEDDSAEDPELDRSIGLSGGSPSDVVEYSVEVTDAIEPGPNANGEDSCNGTTAEGALGGGSDDYQFAGDVVSVDATGECSVTIDGEPVDIEQLEDDGTDGGDGADDEDGANDEPDLSRTIAVSGGSPSNVVEYGIEVTDAIDLGPNANAEDSASGTTASGAVAGGTDDYHFAGDVVSVEASGDVTVTVDGEAVDLGSFDGSDEEETAPEPTEVVEISGGSPSDVIEYQFSVSEVVELGPNANAEDSASGTTASGAVAGGTDDYRFAGEITSFQATGDVSVAINGSSVDPSSLG